MRELRRVPDRRARADRRDVTERRRAVLAVALDRRRGIDRRLPEGRRSGLDRRAIADRRSNHKGIRS